MQYPIGQLLLAACLCCPRPASADAPLAQETMNRVPTILAGDPGQLKAQGLLGVSTSVNRRVDDEQYVGQSKADQGDPSNNFWKPLGSGVAPRLWHNVRASAVYNGLVIVGGEFDSAGGIPANSVAAWDGSSWSALGDGIESGHVTAMAVYQGSLIIAGAFDSVGGISANNIAAWNGVEWTPLGLGVTPGVVRALCIFDGLLVVGGQFWTAGGATANNLAAWNGTSWTSFGSGTDGEIGAMTAYENELIIGGDFGSIDGVSASHIAAWDGFEWSLLGSGIDGYSWGLIVFGDKLIAAGAFSSAGGVPVSNIAAWNSFSWSPLGAGTNGQTTSLAVHDGQLVAGGYFTSAGGVSAGHIAAWNGVKWTPLGSGVNDGIWELAALDSTLLVGGFFTESGGIQSSGVAEWTRRSGSVWHVSLLGNDSLGDGNASNPFRTIQRGIETSMDGDTVLVQDGNYHERLSYYSKAIVVGSWLLRDGDTAHIANTIIDGDPNGLPVSDTTNVIRILGSGIAESQLDGFTVYSGEGDGLLCYDSRLSISNCVFADSGIVLLGNDTLSRWPEIRVRSSRFLNSGITIPRKGIARIAHSEVLGALKSAPTYSQYPEFYVDSSTVSGVEFFDQGTNGNGNIFGRNSVFHCDLGGWYSALLSLNNCVVEGRVLSGIDGQILADSCILSGIGVTQGAYCVANRSLIIGPVTLEDWGNMSGISLTNCTVVDSVIRLGGRPMLSLKRCNLDLPAPIDLFSPFSSVLKIVDTCSNIYAMGQAPFIDVDSALAHFGTFDTSMVTFMPPQFCNPALGDYRLFDTSPCAPANNSCGVLIGARDVGCSALFHCGDADGNDIITISDAVYLINYIFAGGPAPVPILVGDSDCNGIVTISDAVYLINYIFAGGATPCAACP